MTSTVQNFYTPPSYFPAVAAYETMGRKAVYEANRHRIYSLSFWMTGNELEAEELMERTFVAALLGKLPLDGETIDRCLVCELRAMMELGKFTLQCETSTKILNVRRNTRRVDLEQAVIGLPATEKIIFLLHDVEGNDCGQVARVLALNEWQCREGLHQARLRIREVLAAMGS